MPLERIYDPVQPLDLSLGVGVRAFEIGDALIPFGVSIRGRPRAGSAFLHEV